MQNIPPLADLLAAEINHRVFAILLCVSVLLVHLWVVVFLLNPADQDELVKQPIIMEVALVSQQMPVKEIEPPAPPKPAKAKITPPAKKTILPTPVKKKTPVTPKPVDHSKVKEQKIGDEKMAIPVRPVLTESAQQSKPSASFSAPSNTSKAASAVKSGSGDHKSQGVSSGVVELGCPKPKYPNRALSRHIEGWVKVELTISTSGVVTNAQVASAQPAGIFDEAALDAARKCRFKPKMVNGTPVQLKIPKPFRFTLTN